MSKVVADAKYGTTVNFLYLGQLGIPPVVIPTTSFSNTRKDIWGREHFVWLPEEEAYRCPPGKKLHRYSEVRANRRGQCAPSGRERSVHRSWAQGFVEAAEECIASPVD